MTGKGYLKYENVTYNLTVTKGKISPHVRHGHLFGTVPVNGVETDFELNCDRKTGQVDISFGTIKFQTAGKVTVAE